MAPPELPAGSVAADFAFDNCGIDLLARHRIQDAGDDHALVAAQSTFDHAHVAEGLAELYPPLLDHVIGVDREHVAARLIAAHGHFRHQQPGLGPLGHPHPNEIPRQQDVVGILEDAAHLERAGRLVDVGRRVVDHAFVRISVLGLQADLDRNLVDEIGGSHGAFGQLHAYSLHVAFAHIEPDPNRLELHDAGKLAGLVAADQLADRDLACGDDTVERSGDRGIAEVDSRTLGVGLRLQHVGARRVSVGACAIEIGLGRYVLGLQLLLTCELRLGIDQRCLGPFLRGLRLLKLDLIGLRLDHEQRRALFHRGSILIFDLLEVSFHPRDELDGVHRCGIAGRLEVGRDGLLHRQLHDHLWRRRRDEAIFLPATGQQRQKCQADNWPMSGAFHLQ